VSSGQVGAVAGPRLVTDSAAAASAMRAACPASSPFASAAMNAPAWVVTCPAGVHRVDRQPRHLHRGTAGQGEQTSGRSGTHAHSPASPPGQRSSRVRRVNGVSQPGGLARIADQPVGSVQHLRQHPRPARCRQAGRDRRTLRSRRRAAAATRVVRADWLGAAGHTRIDTRALLAIQRQRRTPHETGPTPSRVSP
jgi:hypothetical protein